MLYHVKKSGTIHEKINLKITVGYFTYEIAARLRICKSLLITSYKWLKSRMIKKDNKNTNYNSLL